MKCLYICVCDVYDFSFFFFFFEDLLFLKFSLRSEVETLSHCTG